MVWVFLMCELLGFEGHAEVFLLVQMNSYLIGPLEEKNINTDNNCFFGLRRLI